MSDHPTFEKQAHTDQKPNRLDTLVLEKVQVSWPVEIGLAAILAVVVAFLFAVYARGGPNSSDITLYMNVGLNNIRMPFILNRYFHIFLQKLFLESAAHPLEGHQYFWGFLVGVNAFLIYISARKILKNSTMINGLLALSLFFSVQALAEESGIVYVDLTAMTMIMAMVTVYIFSANRGHSSPWMIGLLGFLLFLAFKTKETTLPAAVLFIGLGWVNEQRFQWQRFLKNLLWVVYGLVAGVVFFALLSGIFLGDPLFGLRIADWREFFGTYISHAAESVWDGKYEDWYQGYWFEHVLTPFILFILSGAYINKKAPAVKKIIWAVPLAFIAYLILTINIRFGYLRRFGLPILPVLCVLAAQFIDLQWPDKINERRKLLVYIGMGIILSVGARFVLRMLASALEWNLQSVVFLYWQPILVTLLLASIFFIEDKIIRNILNLVLILAFIASPVLVNFKLMFSVRRNEAIFTQVVYPFTEFEDEISFRPDMRFYAIDTAFETDRILIVKDINELLSLFNVFFNASSTQDNFKFVYAPRDVATDILMEPFDFVLITMDDWNPIQGNAAVLNRISAQYRALFSADNRLVLLKPID